MANPDTLVSIGHLTSHNVLLGVLGFFIIAILASRNIHAAVLVSIVVTTLLGWMLGDVHYNGIVSAPPSVSTVVGLLLLTIFRVRYWSDCEHSREPARGHHQRYRSVIGMMG